MDRRLEEMDRRLERIRHSNESGVNQSVAILAYRTRRPVEWPASGTDMDRAWISLLPRHGGGPLIAEHGEVIRRLLRRRGASFPRRFRSTPSR
jgi:hypothetical protein